MNTRRVIAFDQASLHAGVVAMNCPSGDVIAWADWEALKGTREDHLAGLNKWARDFISAWMLGLVGMHDNTMVAVEAVFIRSPVGSKALFMAQGAIRLAAAAHELKVIEIYAATWQARLKTFADRGHVKSEQYKRASILLASGAFKGQEISEDVADAYHIGVTAIGKLKEEELYGGGRRRTKAGTRKARANRPIRDEPGS